MDSSGLLRQFRLDMDDLEEPHLWSDEEVLGYASDAQQQFCRKTEGIADSRTPSVCQLTIPDGAEWVPISPLILKLRGGNRVLDGRPVEVINPENLDQVGLRFDGKTGPLRGLVAGLTDGYLRVFPIAKASGATSETVMLSVFRLPLVEITDTDQPLEIQPQHHRHLVLWMRSLAYLKQDSDAYDPRSAENYAAMFENYCFKALQEQERARRTVGTTAYGGL